MGQLHEDLQRVITQITTKPSTLIAQNSFSEYQVGNRIGGALGRWQSYRTNRPLGAKTYELSNHLGNVLATVSDRKLWANKVALIQLSNGKRQLVTGGKYGIELPANTTKLFGHTHPNLSGGGLNTPSIGDREALLKLNQSKTYIFHDGQRTTIYQGKDAMFDTSTTTY